MPGPNKVVVWGDLRSREMVTITHSGGCSVRLTDSDVEVPANAHVKVTAPMVTVDSQMTKFSGVVECDTLISRSVVSANYTPGAANIS